MAGMTGAQIIKELEKTNPMAVTIDGFDHCIIGIVNTHKGAVLLYSEKKIVETLAKKFTLSEKEADKVYEDSILNVMVQEHAPVFLADCVFEKKTEKLKEKK